MSNQFSKTILIAIIIALAAIVFFGSAYILAQNQISRMQKTQETRQTDGKVVSFLNLFIEKVLKAEGEVSFEDRLKLENAVRNLNDKDALLQWEKFTGSKTESEAQNEVKNLLDLLVKRLMK